MASFKKEIGRRVKELRKEHKELKEQNKRYKKVLTAMGVYIERLQGATTSSASIAAPMHLSVSAMGESAGSSEHFMHNRGIEGSQHDGPSTGVRTYFVKSSGAASNDGAPDMSGSFLSTADLEEHNSGRTGKGRQI